jgi:ribosomal protein S18 acetylase RimI-like enzyme
VSGRERAIAHHHARQSAVCDRSVAWEHGTAMLASEVPGFYEYNVVRLEGPDPGISVAELAAAADRLLDGLAHRQVTVEDLGAGERLRPGFEALGWDADRLVWMELEGAAHAAPATAPPEIAEAPLERTRALREAWFSTSGWTPTPAAARDFMVLEERVAGRLGTRALMAWGPGGNAVGYATFAVTGAAAEVEQAYVDPAHRGRGIGGALVAAAVDAAGAETTFIVADDEADAKRLYERLGFTPVWVTHQFTRRPAA